MKRRFRPARLGVGGDTALSTFVQGGVALTNFALRILVLRSLPTEADAGLYSLVITWLSLASSIVDFGLAATLQPRIAASTALASPPLQAGLVTRLAMTGVSWVLINLALVAARRSDLLPYVNLGFLTIVFSARLVGVRQFLDIAWRMNGRGYYAASMALVDGVLALLAALMLIQLDALSVTSVAVLWTLTGIPGFLMLVIPLRKTLVETFRYRLRWRYLKSLSWAALPVAIMCVLGQVSGQMEVLVIDALGSMAEVGRFSIGITPLAGFLFFPGAIASGVAPLFARLHRRPSAASLDDVVSITLRIVGVLAVLLSLTSVLAADEVMLLFPQAGPQSSGIMRAYSGVIAGVFLVVILDAVLLAIGRRRTVLLGSIIGLVAALVLEVLMIRSWGVTGILMAKGASITLLVVFQLYSLHRSGVHGSSRAVLRLVPAAAAFTSVWWLGQGHGAFPEYVLPCLAAAAALVATRIISIGELRVLRSIRLWR